MDLSVGHLNGILARVGGNLNNNFQKSQMPGGLPGGGACWSFDLSDTLHVKLATVHGKKAKVKRNQYEKATVYLNMLRSAHLTRCTLSRGEFQFKIPKMATHNSISLFTNLFCKPKMAVKLRTQRLVQTEVKIPSMYLKSLGFLSYRMINENSKSESAC